MGDSLKSNFNDDPNLKPRIIPLSNGPYYLINDPNPKAVYNIQDFKGEPLSTTVGIALCRCGESKNKPFCDGTHIVVGFSSANKILEENENDDDTKKTAIKDKRRDYLGKKIITHDNRKICSHAVECVKNLPSLFSVGSRPWINSDGSNLNDIIDTIRKCPSGALSYSIDGVEYRDPEEQRNPTITVSKNGPHYIIEGWN
ncbi:MAG TPA: (4Fe-4S)-binding protein [Nitrososphaeraceae archaeon]|nr:(4Fe-4S)-binding protein [Nitrososphaeraceae archaeon]